MADRPAPTPGEHEPATVDARLAALTAEEREVLAKVADIVQRIQFGTVVLVIQDGKVVQIEMAEKFRLR
ncbi:MAG: YezD family protein [Actinomycetota bacterium]